VFAVSTASVFAADEKPAAQKKEEMKKEHKKEMKKEHKEKKAKAEKKKRRRRRRSKLSFSAAPGQGYPCPFYFCSVRACQSPPSADALRGAPLTPRRFSPAAAKIC